MQMDEDNIYFILFAENIRKQMQATTPPLIKHRRKLLRTFPDVFVGVEAVSWSTKTLKMSLQDKEDHEKSQNRVFLNDDQTYQLFQKLMDAGLLQNVTSQELFKNDKSFFRFSADDVDAEKLIRTVAIGYRVFDSAITSHNKLFERVCALGRLVSSECLRASQLVSFLVSGGLCNSREAAIALCRDMVEYNVIKPVDTEVEGFDDIKKFYLFGIDFRKPLLTVEQFLSSNIVSAPPLPNEKEQEIQSSESNLRNKRIHLRQTSDQLVDFSHLSLRRSSTPAEKKNDQPSESACNGDTTEPVLTYKSLVNTDGSLSKAALFHPTAPYVRKNLLVYPDAVGYGFVIRGSGPCYVKIVDPDSPAGKAGLKAHQYITAVNGNDVTEMSHTRIEDLILGGPKVLKISVMHDKTSVQESAKPPARQTSSDSSQSIRKRSPPSLPSAQPWIKNRTSGNSYHSEARYPLASR